MPIVTFSRACHVGAVALGLLLHAPWLVVLDLVLLLVPFFGGPNAYAVIGKMLFKQRLAGAPVEAYQLARFNAAIAIVLYALATIAFFLSWWTAGWVLAGVVALASAVAIAGFCFGCFLYYQFKLNRYRMFGE
jgi:hypothetical protein